MPYTIYEKAGSDAAVATALAALPPGGDSLPANAAGVLTNDGAGTLTWEAVPSGSLDTEGVQDVVGAMVTAAGGTYNDAAGTITLPGGSSSAITADDTPAVPAEGESASYFVTSAVSWPAGLVWSTDPDGGVSPTITGTALVSLLTVGGTTRAIMGATFPASVVPDTTAPTVPAGLSATATGPTTVDLSWSASTDAGGVTGYEYAINAGAAVDAGAGTTETVSGLTAATLYSFTVRAYDAAGNLSAWSIAATATTQAAPVAALSDAIMALSPEAYWKLDETEGTTATDSSGNGHHGEYIGAVVLGDEKGSAKFVAGGTRVLIPDHDAFTFWTTSESTHFAVFKKNTSVSAHTLISKIGATNVAEWNVEARGAPITAQRHGDGLTIYGRGESGGTTTVGTWYAVACALPVNSGTNNVRGELYINSGTAVTSTFSTTAAGPTGNGTSPVVIGCRPDGTMQALANICHVAVFRSKLTAEQVGTLMAAASSDGLI